MLIVDGKMNCRIVHVNFRRLTAEAALLRPVHVVRIYFAAGGATTLLVPTMAPRALCHSTCLFTHNLYNTGANIQTNEPDTMLQMCIFFTDSLR